MPDPDNLPPAYPAAPPEPPRESDEVLVNAALVTVDRTWGALRDHIDIHNLRPEQSDAYESAMALLAKAANALDDFAHTLGRKPTVRRDA